jgi:hypothetical protein
MRKNICEEMDMDGNDYEVKKIGIYEQYNN